MLLRGHEAINFYETAPTKKKENRLTSIFPKGLESEYCLRKNAILKFYYN